MDRQTYNKMHEITEEVISKVNKLAQGILVTLENNLETIIKSYTDNLRTFDNELNNLLKEKEALEEKLKEKKE